VGLRRVDVAKHIHAFGGGNGPAWG